MRNINSTNPKIVERLNSLGCPAVIQRCLPSDKERDKFILTMERVMRLGVSRERLYSLLLADNNTVSATIEALNSEYNIDCSFLQHCTWAYGLAKTRGSRAARRQNRQQVKKRVHRKVVPTTSSIAAVNPIYDHSQAIKDKHPGDKYIYKTKTRGKNVRASFGGSIDSKNSSYDGTKGWNG